MLAKASYILHGAYLLQIFAKFQPTKYDVNLFKGFSMEKFLKIAKFQKKRLLDHSIFMISSN
jgi:hypothetical protein